MLVCERVRRVSSVNANTKTKKQTEEERTLMTLPSADKDWLMDEPSFRRSPVAPVLLARSEPARSMRLNLEDWGLEDRDYHHRGMHLHNILCRRRNTLHWGWAKVQERPLPMGDFRQGDS